MSGVTDQTQYDRLSEDWRHVNNIMWGIPSIAVSIFTGIIVAAYQPDLAGWPRITALGVGSIFLFSITVEIIKKRLLMSAISARLYKLEKNSSEAFPSDTIGLRKEVDNHIKEIKIKNPKATNPDDKDPIYLLFRPSYARQYLGHVVFAAAIVTSILTYSEFVISLKYAWWSYWVGITPVVAISVALVIIRRDVVKKWLKNLWKNRKKVKRK